MDVRRFALALSAAVATVGCGVAALPAAAGAAGSSGDVRLVVGFAPGATASQAAAATSRVGARVLSDIVDLHARVVSVPAAAAPQSLQQLRSDRAVRYAEVDGTATPTDVTPNDPYFPTGSGALSGGEWGTQLTQTPAAWSVTTGSSAVTVAVIDSGVVATQPDLAPVLTPGWNVLTGTSDTSDTFGHGTEVAGVAVAASNNAQGVAAYCWQCKLMPVKVYNSSGAYDSDIAKGIDWAVDHGAQVLNISLGGTNSSVLSSAVSYATTHGVVVVAAAGNSGTTTPVYPAAFPGVISVAGSDQTDTLYSYSNYGSWVSVAAPGATPTTLPNGAYGAVGGTSMASPAVAGIVGLLKSAAPNATPADITNALFDTTDPVAGAHGVAHGRVNAKNAMAALTGSTPSGGSSGSGGSTAVSAPVASAAPTVSGNAQSGQTLTASTGIWSGTPTSYAYQWQRCDTSGAGCTTVSGATTSTYSVGSADVGATLRVVVTATNSGGSGTASSAATAVVTASTVTTTFSGSLTRSASSRTYSTTVAAGSMRGDLSFSKCSSLSLSLLNSAGAVITQGAGPSVLTVSTTVASGTYSWVVSGSCRVSFTLTATSAG